MDRIQSPPQAVPRALLAPAEGIGIIQTPKNQFIQTELILILLVHTMTIGHIEGLQNIDGFLMERLGRLNKSFKG